MRWVCAGLMVLVAACVPGGQTAEPSQRPTPAQATASEPVPGQLPAAEPQLPSLADFRAEAAQSCAQAAATIAAVPLRGDPLHPSARPADRKVAVRHFRAVAAAWTKAAGDLWDFGLPERAVGQRLITALDTLAQYSHQTAETLQAGDDAGAQAALGAMDEAGQQANRTALRLGIGRLEECGVAPVRLPSPRRTRIDAEDFFFAVDEVRRGPTRFVLRNRGTEPHQLFVVRLSQAGTLDDAVRADRRQEDPGAFLGDGRAVSSVVEPGGRTTLDVRLPPGPYGLLCLVASADGTPHAYKGMATEIAVGG